MRKKAKERGWEKNESVITFSFEQYYLGTCDFSPPDLLKASVGQEACVVFSKRRVPIRESLVKLMGQKSLNRIRWKKDRQDIWWDAGGRWSHRSAKWSLWQSFFLCGMSRAKRSPCNKVQFRMSASATNGTRQVKETRRDFVFKTLHLHVLCDI